MSKYPYQFLDYAVDRNAKIATVTFTNPTESNAAPSFAQAMGFGQGFTENSYFHTLGLKLRFEEGDFAFFKELQRIGVSKAVRARQERYAPLGGFGQRDERPIIKD